MERRARPALVCACFFVSIYSLLPHKELRFVLPATPLFNACAAVAVDRCVFQALLPGASVGKKTDGDASHATSATRRMKGAVRLTRVLPALAVFGLWALSVAAHAVFAIAARKNYPGGVAFARLHATDREGRGFDPGSVHVDAAAAMTGVSRFGESADVGSGWVYSKEEGLAPSELALRGFKYLVCGSASVPGYEVIEAVEGFKGLAVTPTRWPVVRARTEPMIWLHRRLMDDDEDHGEGESP